jgi:predicted lysophospholipase L1 biosynthesis ABC-type transport system permease subunit
VEIATCPATSDQDPLGKRFQLDLNFRGDLTEFEVVGVAADVRAANLTRIDPARVYLPTKASEFYPNPMLVWAQGDTGAAEAAVRRALTDLDRTMAPSIFMATLEDGPLRIQRSMAQLLATLGALLASLAIVLAAAGIYGVMAFVVSQRIREIGVRMALGATSREVLGAVVGQGLRPVLAGIGIGVIAAGAFTFAVHATLVSPESFDLFYGLPFYDPPTFLAGSFFLIAVAAAASTFPARRALKVDPVAALRCQ